MGSMSSVDNLFSCKKLKYQITADVSKPRKTVQVNITPIFDALLESFIDFVRMWLFRKMQNIVNLRKTFFFSKKWLVTPQMSIIQFTTLTKCPSVL